MKIILKEELDNLGEKNEVVEVADGYARNYLLPEGMAVPASEGNLRQLEEKKEAEERRERKRREEARKLAEKIDGQMLTIKAETGDSKRLFGSITSGDIVSTLRETTGEEIAASKVVLEENLKELGVHTVPIRLFKDVEVNVNVNVIPEKSE